MNPTLTEEYPPVFGHLFGLVSKIESLYLDGITAAREVADVLIAAGQIVEKCAFAAVLVADEGEGKAHGSSGATVILLASSSLRVSS